MIDPTSSCPWLMDAVTDQYRNLLEQAKSGHFLCPGSNSSFGVQMNNFEQEKGGN